MRSGSPSWDVGLDAPTSTPVAGYVLPMSVQPGDTLHVFLMAPKNLASVRIYRLGWYGGSGARLVAEALDASVPSQPPCAAPLPGPSVCDWTETNHFVIDGLWEPGVYLAKFSSAEGGVGSYPFVVRSNRPALFEVILPFSTYEAYNNWGGTSLYGGPGSSRQESYTNRAVKVSFARPFSVPILHFQFLNVDYLLVRWLEQNGYDVNYITDYDFHLDRGVDQQAVGWLFAGHSEYWSWQMWLRAKNALTQRVSLGFLGGNDIYWLVRYESVSLGGLDAPVLVCYRDAARDPDGATPGLATVRFRSTPNNTPENSLVGVMTVSGTQVQNPPVDLVVANGADPLMSGTGLATGDHISKVAGWEGDRIVDNGATPSGIRVLFQSPYVPVGGSAANDLLQATVYQAQSSTAIVYASGDVGFAWGLSTYGKHAARPALQIFLQNVLQAFAQARSQ